MKKVHKIRAFFLCYYETGDSMDKKNKLDDFGTEDTYKLYRTIYEIIHPTISKKNISNYKIMVDEKLEPLRIFYPKKISKLEKAIIYVPGKSWVVNGVKNYSEVCTNFVKELDTIVIAIDYELNPKRGYHTTVDNCYCTIKYLIEGLDRVGIPKEKITLLGDSTGASILANISSEKEPIIKKQILFYPALNLTFTNKENYPSLEKNTKLDLLTFSHLDSFAKTYITDNYLSPLTKNNDKMWPTTLIITGDLDPVRDEGIELGKRLRQENKNSKAVNIKFSTHGFLNSKDEESIEESMKEIKKFITKKER